MATRAQKTKVGLFVVICGTLIAGGLLLVTGFQKTPRLAYWVEFDESILGLSKDGLVEYLGVPVGMVSNIHVTNENKAHVDLEIAKDKVTLREGVTAQLVLYSLATGTMCVSLEGGEPDKPPLSPGSQIPSRKSLIKNVSSQIESLLDEINTTIKIVKSGLVGMEEGDIALVVQDADALITRGQEFLDHGNEILSNLKGQVESGVEDFRDLAKDVKKLVKDTDEAVKKVTAKLEALKVPELEGNVNAVLKDVSDLSKRLQDAAGAIDTMSRRALHEADNVQYGLRETLRTLNESLNAVRDLMLYLQQDPSALIRGKGKPSGEK